MLTRKSVVLAKIETAYGTDPVPTPVANAILIKDLDIKPTGETMKREFLRSSLSQLQFVRGMKWVTVQFKTELKGTGTRGQVPSWGWEGVLFRACGMSETVTASTSIVYAPVSTGFESATLYVYKDGIFHKVTGCRGTFSIDLSVGKYGEVTWDFTGIYVSPVDATPTAQTFSSVTPPTVLSAALSIGGYSPIAERLQVSLNNQIAARKSMNSATGILEQVITGREPSGSFDPEAVLEATNAFWSQWENATARALTCGPIGSSSGNMITIEAPKIQYQDITYADRNGVLTYECPFSLAMNTGDDELTITFT
jgi:hypothetical protein